MKNINTTIIAHYKHKHIFTIGSDLKSFGQRMGTHTYTYR